MNQTSFLTQAQALLGKAISEHTTQRNAEVKSIINQDRQVAPKRMPLGARLALGDGHESIFEFQVQIKGHNQREYEDKWQGLQNWTYEKLATKLTKDDQQPVLLLPARW